MWEITSTIVTAFFGGLIALVFKYLTEIYTEVEKNKNNKNYVPSYEIASRSYKIAKTFHKFLYLVPSTPDRHSIAKVLQDHATRIGKNNQIFVSTGTIFSVNPLPTTSKYVQMLRKAPRFMAKYLFVFLPIIITISKILFDILKIGYVVFFSSIYWSDNGGVYLAVFLISLLVGFILFVFFAVLITVLVGSLDDGRFSFIVVRGKIDIDGWVRREGIKSSQFVSLEFDKEKFNISDNFGKSLKLGNQEYRSIFRYEDEGSGFDLGFIPNNVMYFARKLGDFDKLEQVKNELTHAIQVQIDIQRSLTVAAQALEDNGADPDRR